MPQPIIAGALTCAQGSDKNLLVSIWQHIKTKIKSQYDTAALAAGLNQGLVTNKDGSVTQDSAGLGITDMSIDEDDLSQSAPNIGYKLDAGMGNKAPTPTGCGDGTNDEYRAVLLCCVPAISVAADGTQSTNKEAVVTLQDAVWNAVGRSFKIDIVDSTQPADGDGLYPVVGYAQIETPRLPKHPASKDSLVIDKRDFKVEFAIKFAVQTFDGL